MLALDMESLILAFSVATQTFNLPPGLMSAICFTETGHRPKAVNPQDGGSKSLGICQIKLGTARLVGFQGKEEELMNPVFNIHYSAKYLRKQLDRYYGNVPKAVSAYNAGTYRQADKGLAKNHKYVKKVFLAWSKGY